MKKESNFKRMMSLYKPHKGLFCLVVFGIILQCGIDLFWPAITRYILNHLLRSSLDEAIISLKMCLYIMLGITALTIFSQWVMTEKASVLTDCIKYDLQKKIYFKYMDMSFSYFDSTRAGSMITMLDYDVDKIDTFMFIFISRTIKIVITLIGAIIMFATISINLILMIIPMLIALALINKIHGKYLFKAFKSMRENNKVRMEDAEDKIAGVRTVISFGNEFIEKCRFSNGCDNAKDIAKSTWMHTWIRNASGGLVENSVVIIILFIGGIMTLKGRVNLADLTVFLMYSGMILAPIRELMDILRDYAKANASFSHITEFLDKNRDIKNPKNPINCDLTNGNIVFNNCTFGYDLSKKPVINNFSLTIEAGKHTAIVGPSGSGKSTVVDLIPRYYDVVKGNITISGINIKDIDLTYLRTHIGVVQQDIYLFYGSIYDNIAYSHKRCDYNEVVKCAKLANCHDFITKLPDGYNTNIGDRGIKLSGGQKQRIAIARVLLENPPIIIFDEATSALDNESEKEVQKAIENISGSRTVITVAHRLSTIRNADEIIFLSENGVEEKGSHDKLIELNGKYAELYKASETIKD